jgi:hypothetical protein
MRAKYFVKITGFIEVPHVRVLLGMREVRHRRSEGSFWSPLARIIHESS